MVHYVYPTWSAQPHRGVGDAPVRQTIQDSFSDVKYVKHQDAWGLLGVYTQLLCNSARAVPSRVDDDQHRGQQSKLEHNRNNTAEFGWKMQRHHGET